MDAIFKRMSVRSYTDEPVAEQDVERLLRAAMAAPSAGNQQPWEFYVVTNPDVLQRLAATSPYGGPIGKAPLGIVVCQRTEDLRFAPIAQQDLGACTENLLLAATDRGLGAVWLGVMPEADRMANVREVLDIPDTLVPFAMVAVGHPDKEGAPKGPERYDASRVHEVR